MNWIPGGFLSVSTFFTLSGFLITSLLLYEWDRAGRIDMGRFWSHRFRRLMPGAFLALAVVALLGATIGDASQVARLRGDALAALFYVSNWRFIYLGTEYADIFASPSLVQHFWSLSIEEQFYLTFPLLAIVLMRLGGRRGFGALVAILALASTAWMALLYDPALPTSRLYFGTDTRAAEILVGALLAIWHAGRPALSERAERLALAIGVFGLAGNLYYWFGVSMETPWLWQGGFLLYAITTAAIILGSVQPAGPTRAFLSWGPFPWLGKISYGVYIYHFSFYVTLTEQTTGLAPWPLFLLRVAATFAVAVPSYYWLELPIRRRRRMVGPRAWIALPVGALIVAGMLVAATVHVPESTIDLRDPTVAEQTLDEGRDLRVMVVGGSISLGVGRGLDRWARSGEQASVVNLAIKGCGIARGGRVANTREHMTVHCDDWPRRWRAAVARFDPDVVVVLVSGWDVTERRFPEWGDEPRVIGDEAFDAWLLEEYDLAVDVLSSRGARVVWLTAPCLAMGWRLDGVHDPDRVVRLNRVLERLAARRGDVLELVDFNAKICPGGAFTNELAGMTAIRPDGAHLSNEAADWIGRWLGEQILAASSGDEAARASRRGPLRPGRQAAVPRS